VLEGILDPRRWTVFRAFDGAAARAGAVAAEPDVILVESRLPDGTWLDLFEFINTQDNPPPVVVMSRTADNRLWAEVLNLGGFDVLPRPLVAAEVSRVLAMALSCGRIHLQRTQ
jgi:DNA-binding response OmpR family regulator